MVEREQCFGRAYLFRLAAWWGLAAGLLEVAILSIKRLSQPFVKLGPDYPWMIPSALVLAFLAIGVLLLLAGKLFKRLADPDVATFFYAVPAFLSLLIMIPGLHHFAAIVLAAGV